MQLTIELELLKMLIYNVTTHIEASVHEEWLAWMKETHIPDVLATGKFLNAKMGKVLIDEDKGGSTYSVQYLTVDRATLEKYYAEDAPRLREAASKRFPGWQIRPIPIYSSGLVMSPSRNPGPSLSCCEKRPSISDTSGL